MPDLKQFEADLIWDAKGWHPEINIEKFSVSVEDQKIAIQVMVSINGQEAFPVDSTSSWNSECPASKTYLLHMCGQAVVSYIREQAEKAKK